jgi:serine/threonine-protein kinase
MRTLTFNRVIGSGAMGTVYHAELKAPGGFVRACAVKVIRISGPDHDHLMKRIRDEARLLGLLQDEHILGVSELVRVAGFDAAIMEYVEGTDLSHLMAAHRLPPRALCELGAEMAGTLHRAHIARHPSTGESLNVIHRDVKPANVMVTQRGGVRLLDFGVARARFSDRESHTQGLVLGTLNYFPPEILGGSEPTPAVDIYGLGVTVWECAMGKSWGNPQASQIRFETRVEARLAELPPEYAPLLPVLRSILQWDPDRRPDGGTVERSLLQCVPQCAGDALRIWAREVSGAMMKREFTEAPNTKGDLVGRTVEVKPPRLGEDSGTPVSAVSPRPSAPEKALPQPAGRRTSFLPVIVVGGFLAAAVAFGLVLVALAVVAVVVQ